MTVLLPLPVVVTRYKCPACARTHSSKSLATKHMARCWYNPDARGCKTCKHFDLVSDHGEFCDQDVSLEGSEECPACYGIGTVDGPEFLDPSVPCPACNGSGGTDGPQRKPGPITSCESWEAEGR